MPNAAARLIVRILHDRDLTTPSRLGINPSLILTPVERELFSTILDYHNDRAHYGQVPSIRWIKERFVGFRDLKVPETMEELCAEVREEVMQTRIDQLALDVSELNKDSPNKAFEALKSGLLDLQRLAPGRCTDLTLADDAEALITDYERRANPDKMIGLPWPWVEVTTELGGIQTEDFAVIFGRPKSMKSWVVAVIGVNAYELANARVLIYGCEMRNLRMMRRVAAAHLHLNYEDLRRGTLPAKVARWYRERLRALREDEISDGRGGRHRSLRFVSAFDDPQGGGVSHLVAKAQEFDPDLIIADSFYRMKDDRTGKRSIRWDHQTNITQDLKGVTQILHVPVIATTQRTRRKGAEETEEEEHTEDIAFADAVGQEADLALRVKKDGMLPTGEVQLRINLATARETRAVGWLLHARVSERWKFAGWLEDSDRLAEIDVPETQQDHVIKNPALQKGGIKRKAVTKKADDLGEAIDRSYYDLGFDVEDLP